MAVSLATGCSQPTRTEAPILQPEPVIEVSAATPRQPSMAEGSLDRSHWQPRSVAPHRSAVDGWAGAGSGSRDTYSGSRAFPAEESVLAGDSSPRLDPARWLTAPLEAAWQVVLLPFAAMGWGDESSAAGESRDYERTPALDSTGRSLGGEPQASPAPPPAE